MNKVRPILHPVKAEIRTHNRYARPLIIPEFDHRAAKTVRLIMVNVLPQDEEEHCHHCLFDIELLEDR